MVSKAKKTRKSKRINPSFTSDDEIEQVTIGANGIEAARSTNSLDQVRDLSTLESEVANMISS